MLTIAFNHVPAGTCIQEQLPAAQSCHMTVLRAQVKLHASVPQTDGWKLILISS